VRATMAVVSFAFLGFLSWAAFANIHEIARTPGEIVPSGFQQAIQHLEGGMVREILVQEGDSVEKGQIVLRLDGAGIEADLKRAQEQALTLQLQEERLRAFLENRAPGFPAEAMARPDMLRDQESFFSSMQAAQEKERGVIRQQIDQKKQSIGALQAELDTARQNFRIVSDLYAKRREMNRQGVMPEARVMETEQQHNHLQGQIRSVQSQIGAAQAAIREYQGRLAALDAGAAEGSNQRLDVIISAQVQNHELITKLRERVARLDVRAPVRGTVKGLAVNTIGNVVQPGQTLMEILPADAPLVVSLKIPPRYIGHIHTGQSVQVKCSSFDFSRYGALPGTLEFISAASFSGDGGERYFQGRVRLSRSHVGEDTRNAIIPGMTVMADIITGEKTVLQYLLKPVRNAMSTAFTER
ncbi:MAG: HlyD family type I secretion periplasmic adaptor subunit, partial [Alphaproteobacteria bacterium]|nr:HlyD family type I secretion periplasmic adaptor subunit [Alphaproteobacteria bacterium]